VPQTAFVTGATGLLGNNLVRALVSRGQHVRALVRSAEKARRAFDDLSIELVLGNMERPESFAASLAGVDVVYHTAAHFRDAYKGGNHRAQLQAINVAGTEQLLGASYDRGVRRFVHVSSTAVIKAPRTDILADETMLRDENDGDDYYRSKILADQRVLAFVDRHPGFHASLILPGWMHGPGDMGPTSAGQLVLDFLGRRLPGNIDTAFSVVDARDVADAAIAASDRGGSGERYLATGSRMSMREVYAVLARVSGVSAPKRTIPFPILFTVAAAGEFANRITRRPLLLSLASVRHMRDEGRLAQFSTAKAERELGARFRPTEETFSDVIDWYRAKGYLARNAAA